LLFSHCHQKRAQGQALQTPAIRDDDETMLPKGGGGGSGRGSMPIGGAGGGGYITRRPDISEAAVAMAIPACEAIISAGPGVGGVGGGGAARAIIALDMP